MHELRDTSGLEMMIQTQLVERGITDERVLGAIRAVPRDRFFPPSSRDEAFADRAAPIGHGQTISQPYIVALMTVCLEVQPSHKVLEIGTGSGYHTAILAHLAAEVYTIERVKPLLDEAWQRLSELKIRNVHFRRGDGTAGWPQAAPFDRVLVGAGAPDVPRRLLFEQMKDNGIAVLPIGPEDEQMLVAVRRRADQLISTDVCPCRFVKLIGQEGWPDDDDAMTV